MSKRYKFLFVTEYFPPFVRGGAEISLNILLESLTKKGHQVIVLTPNYSKGFKIVEKNKNFLVYYYASKRSLFFHPNGKTVSKKIYSHRTLFYSFTSSLVLYFINELRSKIKGVLKENDFDIIHANNYESILALSSLEVGSAKKIAHLRDFGLMCFNRGLLNRGNLCEGCSIANLSSCMHSKSPLIFYLNFLMKFQKKIIREFSSFDHLIAISNFVKYQYLKFFKINPSKISVLYNPIENSIISQDSKASSRKKLGLPLDKKIILFVGTLSYEKGAHFILKLSELLPDLLFVVLGKGPLETNFKKSGSRNLIYKGFVDKYLLKQYYKAADILLVPSLWHEPFGRILLEAAANGLYVLGSNRGAIPEVISWTRCGSYVSPTIKNFYNALLNLLKKSLSCKPFVYDEDTYSNKFIKIIETLKK